MYIVDTRTAMTRTKTLDPQETGKAFLIWVMFETGKAFFSEYLRITVVFTDDN